MCKAFTAVLIFAFVSLNSRVIPAGESIQESIDNNFNETFFELESGVYKGPVSINRTISLIGKSDSIIRSTGSGTTIKVSAPHTKLISLIIDGSGIRYDLKDAAIYVGADRVLIASNTIINATFGIVVEKSKFVTVRNNRIEGNPNQIIGMRGDGIRVWETSHSSFISNSVNHSRDLVFWYSYSNQMSYNHVKNGRYGSHYMYSHYNKIHHNKYISNVVGNFIMYSHNYESWDNLYVGASGMTGYGLGIKESSSLFFSNNIFVKNTIGIYSDNAPYLLSKKNWFSQNFFVFSHIAIQFHGSLKENYFEKNYFLNNRIPVQVTGNSSAQEVFWEKNFFDDYIGYDLNKDKIGDISYEYKKLVSDLVTRFPGLNFFQGTIAFFLINLVGEVIPLFKPQLIFSDPLPLTEYPRIEY